MFHPRITGALFSAILAVAALAMVPTAARAQSFDGNDGAQLALGVGGFNVLHPSISGIGRGEYRFGAKLWAIRPFIGVEGTTRNSVYGYGGFGIELFLGDHWMITPNFAVGAYDRGDAKRLGSTIEFRSGAELDYRFENHSRLGFSFHHISNAGMTRENPGVEEALVIWSIPLQGFW